MGGVGIGFLIIALGVAYFEARSHKLQYFLYGYPVKPWIVKGIPVMQYATEVGWTNCLKKMDIDVDIVFYGNSITRQSDFQKCYSDKKICNLGLGGDNLDGLFRRIEMVKTVRPEKVFFLGGINDSKWISPDSFTVKYERIVKAMRDSLPGTIIYLQSILPVNHKVYDKYADNEKIKRLNDSIKCIAVRNKTEYINIYSLYERDGEMPDSLTIDGIHLKPVHYKRWADALRTYVYD